MSHNKDLLYLLTYLLTSRQCQVKESKTSHKTTLNIAVPPPRWTVNVDAVLQLRPAVQRPYSKDQDQLLQDQDQSRQMKHKTNTHWSQ